MVPRSAIELSMASTLRLTHRLLALILSIVGILLVFNSQAYAQPPTPTPAPTTVLAPTATPTTPAPSTNPLSDVFGSNALFFIGIVGLLIALLWFTPLFYDMWQANKWRRVGQTGLLDQLMKQASAGGKGLSTEEVRQLASAMDRAPRGASGLTQSLLALTIASLVGVAMLVTLISTANDSGDLRKTIVTSLLSILATIAGFYFGARTAQTSTEQATKPPEASAQPPQGPTSVPPNGSTKADAPTETSKSKSQDDSATTTDPPT